jgi:hypothetical protein
MEDYITMWSSHHNPAIIIAVLLVRNDLEHVKVGFLRNRIKNIIRKIKALLPNTRIIWSEILHTNQWRYSQNHDAMNVLEKESQISDFRHDVTCGHPTITLP